MAAHQVWPRVRALLLANPSAPTVVLSFEAAHHVNVAEFIDRVCDLIFADGFVGTQFRALEFRVAKRPPPPESLNPAAEARPGRSIRPWRVLMATDKVEEHG